MQLFLSLQDPRELPKGTRDPMGFEIIWSKYGREIIGNLTTITSSIEEFVTALFGFYLSEHEDSNEQSDRFIRYEQIAAYLRQKNVEKGGFVRGVTQASKNLQKLSEGEKIFVSASKRDQILSSQKAYGLWGLYSTALNDSGLIQNRKVIEQGAELAKTMADSHIDLVKYLKEYIENEETAVVYSDIEKYSAQFISLLEKNKMSLLKLLLLGKESLKFQLQREFYNVLESHKEELQQGFNQWKIISLLIDDDSMGDRLKEKLSNIDKIDQVLAVINELFGFMRLPENKDKYLSEVAELLSEQAKGIILELPDVSSSQHLSKFVQEWNEQKYEAALREVLDLHRLVMDKRHSGYWVEEFNKKLKIQIPEPKANLQIEKGMHSSYSYFIGSMLSLYKQYISEED